MSVGLVELLVVVISLIFILAVPAIVIAAAVFLLRRLRELEDRVARLEQEKQEGDAPG